MLVSSTPSQILIIGSGVFGLSTAHSLALNPRYRNTKICVVDRLPFPAQDAASIDSSRIVRSDYGDPAYAALGALAMQSWRKQADNELGGQGRYTQSGLLYMTTKGTKGESYVKKSYETVERLLKEGGVDVNKSLRQLKTREEVEQATKTEGSVGDIGYINYTSGWVDAEASLRFLRTQVENLNRVDFVTGEATELLKTDQSNNITGVKLSDGTLLAADLVIVAAGSWTPKLVDLRGRATATGQVLCYMQLTEEEQESLKDMPAIIGKPSACYILPPRNRVLKIARHGYGYSNPQSVPLPRTATSPDPTFTISVPWTRVDEPGLGVPKEGREYCSAFLGACIPSLAGREFFHTRICWYTDTPKGDFLITYHPDFNGSLFLATGGNGHAFKFLPVLGDRIVECLGGNCPDLFKQKWSWGSGVDGDLVTNDGSRGGRYGMLLSQELES